MFILQNQKPVVLCVAHVFLSVQKVLHLCFGIAVSVCVRNLADVCNLFLLTGGRGCLQKYRRTVTEKRTSTQQRPEGTLQEWVEKLERQALNQLPPTLNVLPRHTIMVTICNMATIRAARRGTNRGWAH